MTTKQTVTEKNDTLTRAALSEAVYREIGLSLAESGDLVDDVLEHVVQALEGGTAVKISSFGTFTVRQKKQRIGRNPKTGVEVPITPRRVLSFRPSNLLKEDINKHLAGAKAKRKATSAA
ncbi:integration host factor subunit alpha [bacterium]|nr:integration host factor subunit alpha [bacterium]